MIFYCTHYNSIEKQVCRSKMFSFYLVTFYINIYRFVLALKSLRMDGARVCGKQIPYPWKQLSQITSCYLCAQPAVAAAHFRPHNKTNGFFSFVREMFAVLSGITPMSRRNPAWRELCLLRLRTCDVTRKGSSIIKLARWQIFQNPSSIKARRCTAFCRCCRLQFALSGGRALFALVNCIQSPALNAARAVLCHSRWRLLTAFCSPKSAGEKWSDREDEP